MSKHPLQLKEYYFPLQNVEANPDFNPQIGDSETKVRVGFSLSGTDDPSLVVADIKIEADPSASTNPPYFFTLQAFGVFHREADAESILSHGRDDALHVLMGAARERLTELTSRGPWGRYFMKIAAL